MPSLRGRARVCACHGSVADLVDTITMSTERVRFVACYQLNQRSRSRHSRRYRFAGVAEVGRLFPIAGPTPGTTLGGLLLHHKNAEEPNDLRLDGQGICHYSNGDGTCSVTLVFAADPTPATTVSHADLRGRGSHSSGQVFATAKLHPSVRFRVLLENKSGRVLNGVARDPSEGHEESQLGAPLSAAGHLHSPDRSALRRKESRDRAPGLRINSGSARGLLLDRRRRDYELHAAPEDERRRQRAPRPGSRGAGGGRIATGCPEQFLGKRFMGGSVEVRASCAVW